MAHRCKMYYLDSPHCRYCETTFDIYSIRTRDHIIPISRGGKNGYPNKAVCCPVCNSAKGNKLPSEFLLIIQTAYKEKIKYRGINIEVMPNIIKNLVYNFTKKENDPEHLNPTVKRLYVELNRNS